MPADLIAVFLLSLLPVSESRGSVIYGLARGLDPLQVIAVSIIGNSIPAIVLPRILDYVERIATRFGLGALYLKYIERVRRRGRKYVERWGYIGVALFVAVPLPTSGVYSGALLAHVLGLRRVEPALVSGAVIAALLVYALYSALQKP